MKYKANADPETMLLNWWLSATVEHPTRARIVFVWAAPTIQARFQSLVIPVGVN